MDTHELESLEQIIGRMLKTTYWLGPQPVSPRIFIHFEYISTHEQPLIEQGAAKKGLSVRFYDGAVAIYIS